MVLKQKLLNLFAASAFLIGGTAFTMNIAEAGDRHYHNLSHYGAHKGTNPAIDPRLHHSKRHIYHKNGNRHLKHHRRHYHRGHAYRHKGYSRHHPYYGYHHAYRGHKYRRRHHRNRDIIASGAIGLVTGAILGNALSHNNKHYTNTPRVVRYAPKPWSAEWYRYCASKYRSFDARTGTYQPYHGPRKLCR